MDVADLDCDFYVFSAHKLYGPTGFGVLWARDDILDAMPPWQGGGAMIDRVTFERTTYAPPPARFEAGTPHIVGALGLHAAIDYVEGIGLDAIHAHETALVDLTRERLGAINSVRLFGPDDSAGIVSFAVEGVHPHDIGTILDEERVAIRAGHHCAQPLMDRLGVPATARASFGVYNSAADVAATKLLLDARPADRFAGQNETVDPVPGHIPGAVSAPALANLTPSGEFLSSDDLAMRFTALGIRPDSEVGVYCGSGVQATHLALALEASGIHPQTSVYIGSWSHWITDPERPVES